MSFLTLSEFKEEAKGDRDVRESWDTWRSLTKQDGSKTGRLPQDFTPKQWFAMEHAVTSLSKSCTSSTSTLPIASGEGPNVQVRNAHRLFSSMPVRPFANKNVLEFTSRRRNVKCYCLRQVVVVVDLKDLPFCTPGHSSTAIGCIAARQIVTSPSFGPAHNFLFLCRTLANTSAPIERITAGPIATSLSPRPFGDPHTVYRNSVYFPTAIRRIFSGKGFTNPSTAAIDRYTLYCPNARAPIVNGSYEASFAPTATVPDDCHTADAVAIWAIV